LKFEAKSGKEYSGKETRMSTRYENEKPGAQARSKQVTQNLLWSQKQALQSLEEL
jgi:hypothetical protein